MSLITSASRAGKVVKNAGRMREIVAAMTRLGFGAVVDRMGFRSFRAPRVNEDIDLTRRAEMQPIPVRVRILCERLGPAFIKVGQILAGRPDLVPAEWVREFEKLQDNVPAVPFSVLKPMLEEELGRPLENCFASFDTEPMASASIAQVHAARTLDGDDVVVKIQKPDVARLLNQDLDILQLVAQALERYVAEVKPFRPTQIIEEFRRSILSELSFTREANSIKRFRDNFSSNTFLVVPKVYSELSSNRVLTMERLRGVKLNDIEGVRNLGIDPKELLRQGMDCFFKSILIDGFFHGDPHGGNILVLADGRMGLFDFGSVGWLSQKAKNSIVNMFLAIISEDYEALVIEYLQLTPPSSGSRSSTKIEAIQTEVGNLFTPYHGLPLKDIPAGKLLMDATGVAFRNDVTLPRDLVLVFKVIMTLEGMGRMLDPDFDLVGAAGKFSSAMLKDRFDPSRLLKDLLFVGRDTARFLQTAPRQLGETLRQIESGELRINIRLAGLEKHTRAQGQAAARISFAILTVGMLMCSAYITSTEALSFWPQIAFWTASLSATFICFFRNFRA